MKIQHTPGNAVSRKYLADKLGLTMLFDRSPRKMGTKFIVQDTMPADHIKLLPKGHWKVLR